MPNSINGTSNDGLGSMMQMMMVSKMMQGGNSESGGSYNIAFASLLSAMKEKNLAESKYEHSLSNNGNSDLNNIMNVVLRPNYNLESILSGNNISNLNSNNETIESEIKKASQKYGVDENIIRTIIKIESDFNPNVTSSAGAKGLMQLMPENIKHYGVSNPYDISENIDAGTRHIKDYNQMYNGNLQMALAAYNCGPGTMSTRGVTSISDFHKLPLETQNYIQKVKKYLG